MEKKNPRSSSSSSKTERKATERNRRFKMKCLLSELHSLVAASRSSREPASSLPDQLGEAANYIRKLNVKVEKLREKKESMLGIENLNASMSGAAMMGCNNNQAEVKVQVSGSAVEVVLVTGLLDGQHVFTEAVKVLHEDGVEIVQASFAVVGDAVFHTIHCKVAWNGQYEPNSLEGRISARLKMMVDDANRFTCP